MTETSPIVEHANALQAAAVNPEQLTLAELEAILEAVLALLPGILNLVASLEAK